jgi:hypothetical protein
LTAADDEARLGVTRGRIVAALGAIPGLVSYASAPDQATAGAAWPRWVQTTYAGNISTLAASAYDVLVTLPADYAGTTVDEGDSFRDVVGLALVRLGRVAYAERFQSPNDRQTMPGLRSQKSERASWCAHPGPLGPES